MPRVASSMPANIKNEFSSTVAKKAATSLKAQNIKQAIVKRAKHRARIGALQKKRYVPPPLPFAKMEIVKKPISSDLQRRALKLAIEIQETVNPPELAESSDTSSDDTLSADEAKEAMQEEARQKKVFYKPPVIPLKSYPTTPVKVQNKKPIKKPVGAGNHLASKLTNSIANRRTVSLPGSVPIRIQAPNSNHLIYLAGAGSLNRRPATTIATVTPSSVSNVNLPGLASNQKVLVPLSNFFQILPTTQNNPQFSTGTQLRMATGRQSVLQPSPQSALGPKTVAYLMPSVNSGQLTNYGGGGIAMPPFLAGPNQPVQTILVRVTNPGQATPLSSVVSSTPKMQAPSNAILNTNTVTTATSSGLVLKPQAANRKRIPAKFRKVLMDEAQVKRLEADLAREQKIIERKKKLHEEQCALLQRHCGDLTVSTVNESAASLSSKGKNSLQITVSENQPRQRARKSFKSSFISSKMRGLTPSISTLPLKTPEKLLKPTFASQKPIQSTTKPSATTLPQQALKSSTPKISSAQEFYIQHQTADGQQKTFKLVKLPPNHPSITAFKNKIPQTLTTTSETQPQPITINTGIPPGFKNNPTNPALLSVFETVSLAIDQTTENMINPLLFPNTPGMDPALLPKSKENRSGNLSISTEVMEEVLPDEKN